MGTRADFYIGKGITMEWLGSIAWDGYPSGIDAAIFKSTTKETYHQRVFKFLAADESATFPHQGWPWPWDDSCTTDYAYTFVDGEVWVSSFGTVFITLAEFDKVNESDEAYEEWEKKGKEVFPNMKDRKNVTLGPRSGIIIMGG